MEPRILWICFTCILGMSLCIGFGLCLETGGQDCVTNDSCGMDEGVTRGNKVKDMTYCCLDPSSYLDLQQAGPDNVTCSCLSRSRAAATFADRTMAEGYRTCHWGPACNSVESRLSVEGSFLNATFCCPASQQFPHLTHFGPNDVVCRCRGSSRPLDLLRRYVPTPTGNASSSGERCLYNLDCDDSPSLLCNSQHLNFCCYGSRGLETMNDEGASITRCTCTNDFLGARCAQQPAFPISTNAGRCESGNSCTQRIDGQTCFHGNRVFCCQDQGVNLTILDDVITSCACVATGSHCNVTFTSSEASVTHYPMIFLALTSVMFWQTT